MQPIEKALKNVFRSIGNSYELPKGDFILDDFGNGNKFRNPYHGQSPSKVKFMFGTQKELNVWLNANSDKYPLVWLVYPIEESYKNDPSGSYTYKASRLIFAINSNSTDLVQFRLQTTRFILDQLTKKFTALMRNSTFRRYISIDKQSEITEKFYPNYSTNEQKDSKTIDIWDAISFDCDLHLIPNCIN